MVHYSTDSNIAQFKLTPKCCIQTKMYRLCRKMTIYGCFFFCIVFTAFFFNTVVQKGIDHKDKLPFIVVFLTG